MEMCTMRSKLFISTNLGGKLKGITGITTYHGSCEFCKKMQKDEKNVCRFCYAKDIDKRNWTNAIENYKENTKKLSEHMYRSELPNLMYDNAGTNLVRFDTHGEVPNLECLINFLKIARANYRFRFALWTKRTDLLIEAAEKGIITPKNVCIVVSSIRLNEPISQDMLDKLQKAGVFVDTVFTVYTDKYIAENNIKITCGDRDCAKCLKCYTHHYKQIKFINERLKGVNQKELDI